MKSLVLLTVIVPGICSLKCYSCATNYSPIIRIYPPLFFDGFFSSMGTKHWCEDDPNKQIRDDCKSFCVSEYIHQTYNFGNQQTMWFRACADDVLVGAIDYALNMNCSGTIQNYTTQGYPLGEISSMYYYATGNGIACNWDLCNHQNESQLQSNPQQTCKPCDHWICPDNTCTTNDGYTAQCNCTFSGKNVSCGSLPTLKTSSTSTTSSTSASTTSTSSTTSSTSTSSTTATSTVTTTTTSISTTSSTTSSSTSTTTSISTTTQTTFTVGVIAGVSAGVAVLTTIVVSVICCAIRKQSFAESPPALEMSTRSEPRAEPPAAIPEPRTNHYGIPNNANEEIEDHDYDDFDDHEYDEIEDPEQTPYYSMPPVGPQQQSAQQYEIPNSRIQPRNTLCT